MHVTIAEARDHISPVGIDNFGLGTNAVACIRHHTGNPPMFDCNVVIWQRLARVDVDPDTAAYDGIRRCATRSNIDEGWGGGGPRWEKGMFHILLDQKPKPAQGLACVVLKLTRNSAIDGRQKENPISKRSRVDGEQ